MNAEAETETPDADVDGYVADQPEASDDRYQVPETKCPKPKVQAEAQPLPRRQRVRLFSHKFTAGVPLCD